MRLVMKAVLTYFKRSLDFSSGNITKLEYIVGIVLSWLLFRGVKEVKSLLKKSEECDTSANMFCIVEAQLHNGFIEIIILFANLYIMIALAALVNRELIAIGKFKQVFKNSFVYRNVFILLIYIVFQGLVFKGLAPLFFAVLYFEPRETEKETKK